MLQESEVLENQNQDLKSQIQELETQRRRLMDMLSMHKPTCMKNLPYSPDTAAATYCTDPATSSIGAAFCNDTTTTTSSGGYHHYSGVYTDNGCMA
jgi:hypothetical protein